MRLTVVAPDGVPEIAAGDDLAALVRRHCAPADGDVLLVTSKAVSKAEGRLRSGDRDAWVEAETRRVVARRGPTRIVENRLGLVQAAAGVDASNVPAGQAALLPLDPDASARGLRQALGEALAGSGAAANVAVVITDTFGRAWRTGQTDLAIGVAGMMPLDDHAGRVDAHGNALAVTAPAVADELAAAAQLAAGKLAGRPFVLVSGLDGVVLPPGVHGPGVAPLLRPREQDLFALGAREAALAALAGTDPDCFGTPAEPDEVVAALVRAGVRAVPEGDGSLVAEGDPTAAAVVARAHAWSAVPVPSPGPGRTVRLRPGSP